MRRIISKTDVLRSVESTATSPTSETGDFIDLTARRASATAAVPPVDDYVSKLVKLIPAEVVTAFVTIDNVIRSGDNRVPPMVYWWITAVLLIATPLYLWRVTQAPKL